jgi:hypothetical protein
MTSAINLSLMNNNITTARRTLMAVYSEHLNTINAMPISESAKDLAKKTLVDSYVAEMGELIEKGL